jgi:hypothetical protein
MFTITNKLERRRSRRGPAPRSRPTAWPERLPSFARPGRVRRASPGRPTIVG